MKEYLLERVTAVEPLGEYRVRVTFSDAFSASIDLAPLLFDGPIFQALRDEAFFKGVRIEHGVPVWSDDVDLSPGSLRAWCEAGRVLSRDETDEWIAKHSRAPEKVA
jgi:hypothetical protein